MEKTKKTLCYSVALQSRVEYDKTFKLTAYDGSSIFAPKMAVFGDDLGKMNSDTCHVWVAAWILESREREGKPLQHSKKRSGWYDPTTGKVTVAGKFEVVEVVPEPLAPDHSEVEDLRK